MKGKVVYLLHNQTEGYKVIVSEDEVKKTVLDYYMTRHVADQVVRELMHDGYHIRGVIREEDLI